MFIADTKQCQTNREGTSVGSGSNPRRSNGNRRNKIRRALKERGAPCHICGMPIDYSLPAGDPMSFEVDEIIPVSRFWEGGYPNAKACALDIHNCAAAHRICNQKRGNKRDEDRSMTDKLSLPLTQEW